MGVVYRGERVALRRPVAIKFLNEGYAATDDGRRRFEVEARAMSRLEHPNCVPVTDFGVDEGAPYLVMDFVTGRTLREVLVADGRLPARRAIAIVSQILSGVAHAHAQGIIHRDLKPENILVTSVEGHDDHVRIVDFGLAKLRDEGSFTTGVALGTPGYMSPEQTVGQKADERADVYACGIILYELLGGTKPFQAASPFEVMRMHREDDPAPLATVAPDAAVPPWLEAVVRKALAKSRDDRYASASEFRAALDAGDPEGATPRSRGGRGRAILIGGSLGAVVGGGFLAWRLTHRAAPTPAAPATPAIARPVEPTPDARPAAHGKKPAVATRAVDAGVPDAAPVAAPAPDDGGVEPDEIARLRALATDDDNPKGAIAGLEKLRATRPEDPAIHYALANLYAQTQAWPQAVKAYAATVRLDPGYRTDPRVISDAVEALGSNQAHGVAAMLIEHELGAAAIPRLEEASRSTNRALRGRARKLLARLR